MAVMFTPHDDNELIKTQTISELNPEIVLVLGAGASAHLDFPQNQDLCDQILRGVGDSGQELYKLLRKIGFEEERINEFHSELGRSMSETIDEFLDLQSDFVDVGRAAIAHTLMAHEKISTLRRRQNNWYLLLKDHVCNRYKNKTGGLVIVTFNYDRSIDQCLFDMVDSRAKKHGGATSFEQFLPILHVHGRLGHLPHQRFTVRTIPYEAKLDPDKILYASKGIRVACELEKDHGLEMVRAQKAIANAKKVAFLGFGFHDQNLGRLRIADWNTPGKYTGTAFMLDNKKRKELRDLSSGNLNLGPRDEMIMQFLKRYEIF